MKQFLCLFVALAVSAGCQEAPSGAADVGLPTPNITIRSYQAPSPGPVTREERFAHHDAGSDAMAETRRVLRTSATWQEAHGRLQTLVSEQTDPVRSRAYIQAAATRMLQPKVISDEGAEASDAIGRYVEGLVASGSVDTPLVADALGRLEGRWTEARIRRVAKAIIRVVDEQAAARSGRAQSTDQTPTLARHTGGPEAAFEAHATTSTEGLRRLAGDS